MLGGNRHIKKKLIYIFLLSSTLSFAIDARFNSISAEYETLKTKSKQNENLGTESKTVWVAWLPKWHPPP